MRDHLKLWRRRMRLYCATPVAMLPTAIGRRRLRRRIDPKRLSRTLPSGRTLWIDVSVVVRDNARTGVQRTVLNLLRECLARPPEGMRVQAVCTAEHRPGYVEVDATAVLAGTGQPLLAGTPIEPACGDVFLGLDLAAHLLPTQTQTLIAWQRRGTWLVFVLYDLLPVLRPQWFNERTAWSYGLWLQTLCLLADEVICISRAVAQEFQCWLETTHGIPRHEIGVHAIHLGTDLGLPAAARTSPPPWRLPKGDPSILMVGTLEPRKGHAQALAAFELLWDRGMDAVLLIAGKPGWMIDPLAQRIRKHPEHGYRLFWFEQPSDEFLASLYAQCDGLLMASLGEGFGLPIIEAASYGKPVMMRDLPVFRELCGDAGSYFEGEQPKALADALSPWLDRLRQPSQVAFRPIPWQSWRESGAELVHCLESLASHSLDTTPS